MTHNPDGEPRPRRSQARSLAIFILPVAVLILAVAAVVRFDLVSRLRGSAPPVATPAATTGAPAALNATATPTRIVLATARPANTPFATVALEPTATLTVTVAAPTAAADTPTAAPGTPTAEPSPEESPTDVATPEPTPTSTVPTATTIGDSTVNLRAEPSLDGEILATLEPNTPVILLGLSEDGVWWQVREPQSGVEGWMHSITLVTPEPATATPTEAVPPEDTATPPADATAEPVTTPVEGDATPTAAATTVEEATPGATAEPATTPVEGEATPTAAATTAETTATPVAAQPPEGEYATRYFAISFPEPVQRLATIDNNTGGRTAQGVWLVVPVRWRNTATQRFDTYVNGPTLCIVHPDNPAACLREDVLARADYFRNQGRTWFDWMVEPEASVDGWLVFDVPQDLTAAVLRIYFDAPWDDIVAEVALE